MARFNGYLWRARVSPAVIASLPVLALVTFVAENPIVGVLAPAIGVVTIVYLAAAEWVRSRGLKLEQRLKKAWGGMPTSQALRSLSGPNSSLSAKRRDVRRLSGMKLPPLSGDSVDSSAHERRYEEAVRAAIATIRTGSSDSALLASENASYGFRRNLRGIKAPALVLLALCTAVNLLVALYTGRLVLGGVVLAADILTGIFWVAVVRDDWVKEQAEKFATQFFTVAHLAARAQQVGQREEHVED